MGVHFRGQVGKGNQKITYFGLKKGKGLVNSGAHPLKSQTITPSRTFTHRAGLCLTSFQSLQFMSKVQQTPLRRLHLHAILQYLFTLLELEGKAEDILRN